jgi:hypothetical protein
MWALVSETGTVVEWFSSPGDAAQALADVVRDEPDWQGVLYVAEADVEPSGIVSVE